ncbi:MAG: hypothetical protein P0Y53_23165 [Candidatus Pseudobacter hemicellulosilyticus]|uniref:YD repeat-containing protein n=1 Tax=Candidatus Pseudobacter hemicellulosilyticus TaxID=3121375 RepID=A0AAJ6BFR7_9BACT|nr:MAG: hypothetical protein P0Y53_23165 [Pseudobacter sp.]
MRSIFYLFLVFALLTSDVANSQFYQPDQTIIHQNKNPSSPTAASLSRYADFPVDYFSGSVNVSIPLADLQVDGFQLPVTLSNLPTGIRVMSCASWVGTGWSLLAGGVITRNVVDVPDDRENFANGTGYSYVKDKQTVLHQGSDPNVVVTKPPFNIMQEVQETDDVANAWRLWALKDEANCVGAGQHYDTEPDVFSFNFLGRSGKFFISADKQVIQAVHSNLKFELNYVNTTDFDRQNSLKGITITDENGVKYFFDQTEYTSNRTLSYRYNLNTPYAGPSWGAGFNFSAWYLSKILLTNNEEILFSYSEENQKFPYVFRSHSIRNSPGADGDAADNVLGPNDNWPQMSAASSTFEQDAKRLTAIESRLWKVEFIAAHQRLEVEGAAALTSINLYAKQGQASTMVRQWKFNTRYHQCRTDYQVPDYPVNNGRSYSTDVFKRLMLDNIEEISGTKVSRKYQFEYYEHYPMAGPSSAQQDFWGYYNGRNSKSLLPAINIYPGQAEGYKKYSVYHLPYPTAGAPSLSLPGASRVPSWDYAQLGALKKVIYPTGGSVTFEYESNEYEFEGVKYLGPGIRIRRTVQHDGIKEMNDIVKEYKYYNPGNENSSSGVLFDFPAFAYMENTHDYIAPYVEIGNGSYYGTPHSTGFPYDYGQFDIRKYRYFLSRMDNPQIISSGLNGNSFGYRYVTVIVNNKHITQYRYSCPVPFGQVGDPVGDPDREFGAGGDDLFQAPRNFVCRDPGGYGWGKSCATGIVMYTASLDNPLVSAQMEVGQYFCYPFAPSTSYDWTRGLLISQTDFDENDRIVKEVIRKYKLFTPNNAGPAYLPAVRIGYSENYGPAGINPNTGQPNNVYRNIYMASKYRLMGEISKLPESEEVTTYPFPYLASGPIVEKFTFTYRSADGQVDNVSYVNSKGEVRSIANKYPSDFMINGNVYQEMVNKNMISEVIEKASFLRGQEIRKEEAGYDRFSGLIRPRLFKNSLGGHPTEIVLENSLYDNKGNVLEAQSRNGIQTAFLYGYNKSQVVARVTNQSYASIASLVDQSILDNPSSDDALRTELGKLRNGTISNMLVTTYTYQPLVGITSVTDERNLTTYYEYDDFGRLMLERDNDRNILRRYCYNYAGQPLDCQSDPTPNWQETSETRCEPCALNNQYNAGSGLSERKLVDANINSPTYGSVRWVSIGSLYYTCYLSPADWQNTAIAVRCRKVDGINTGELEQEQRDINPCSATYDQTQWIVVGTNTAECPGVNNVQLKYFNVYGESNWTAKYVNNATGGAYLFNIPTNSAPWQPLGTIPAGNYTLTITPAGSGTWLISSGCMYDIRIVNGAPAVFENVPVSSSDCNSISIDMPDRKL